ncbi:MAG: MFS transporter [Terriglobales bacterium]|jgi:MFS family permease
MAESGIVPLSEVVPYKPGSPWAPLRQPLFLSLWTASLISHTGTWMQNLGTGWLMTSLTMSPIMVSLVQVAMSLPVFLLALPAGALADISDRRRVLLFTQGWMALAAGALGLLTIYGAVTPWLLLLFTFVLGAGAVMNEPAWQAITPELVPEEQHSSAVALNSVGFNAARAVGPALAGLIIAGAGSGLAFLLNALSFSGVIVFLYRWRRPHDGAVRNENEDVLSAIRAGVRYVRQSHLVKSVLVRTAAFSFSACALLALLPLIARPFGSVGYGLMLGSFGSGALAGAAILPRFRRRNSMDGTVAAATAGFAAVTFLAGRLPWFSLLCLDLFGGGIAWMWILACLNVAAQTMSPPRLRARTLSMYILVLQGGMAAGSAAWGAIAERFGVPAAMLGAALGLAVGVFAIRGGHRPLAVTSWPAAEREQPRI